MDGPQAAKDTQLFVHELTHGAVAICFPGGRPWLHQGMASLYETARIDGGELILGMPAYGFVLMTNVEPMFDIYSPSRKRCRSLDASKPALAGLRRASKG